MTGAEEWERKHREHAAWERSLLDQCGMSNRRLNRAGPIRSERTKATAHARQQFGNAMRAVKMVHRKHDQKEVTRRRVLETAILVVQKALRHHKQMSHATLSREVRRQLALSGNPRDAKTVRAVLAPVLPSEKQKTRPPQIPA